MFFSVVLTAFSIGCMISATSFVLANNGGGLIRKPKPTIHDFRAKLERDGYVLHMPSYMNGNEKYVIPEFQNSAVDAWRLIDPYEIN